MTPPLTDAAASVWGKTDRTGTSLIGWLPLWRHLADTAAVAGRLWDGWLSPSVAQRISSELPGGAEDGRTLLTWLAGIHDIGKATPAFASQARPFADRMRANGLDYHEERIKQDRKLAPHATAGQVILADWLADGHGWEDNIHAYAVVVGGHHGTPPTDENITQVNFHRHLLGDSSWIEVQHELLAWMTERTGAADRLADWGEARLSQPVQAALTGLVIVADWIASNEEFFPYELTTAESERIESAWRTLDLPAPWTPVPHLSTVDQLFAARFELPPGASPRPVQRTVAELAAEMPVPGMLIVEAAMGEGKTEAALAAVEILAGRSGASGCLIALPTRATSDAMFGRVLSWLRRLPDADVGRGARDIKLAHGKAAFNSDFSGLIYRNAMPSGISIEEGGSAVGVHQWLAGRKRSMLSSFVIGTIDQLLFAALRSRHLVLRHLGLAGKIVVIDEAHAYDVFMSCFLDRALEWLAAYGVPVIVLSATLPAHRRAEMMAAYDRGRLGALPRPTWRNPGPPPDHYAGQRNDLRYPLVTVSTADRGAASHECADSGRGITVRLEPLDDSPEHLAALLRAALADGGCALVVRNTVARVQQTAEELREVLGTDYPVSVAHSRFMAPDRAAKDRWLREAFGPPGSGERPARHIVVASQVAEQSLDIDFDLLVTDLAPVDLMLQRIGRLHRHDRPDRPPHLAEATCHVTGADWTAVPPKPVAGSRRVYQESALLRSAAVLWPMLTEDISLRLPADISILTQAAYGQEQVGDEGWQPAMAEAFETAEKQRADKESRAGGFRLDNVAEPGTPLIGWLTGGVGNTDDRAGQGHVRDDDAESLEVIVLVRTPDGLVVPPWVDRSAGVEVSTEAVPPRQLVRDIARCTLPLPRLMTAPDVIDGVIAALEGSLDLRAWQDDRWLGGELVLVLDEDGRAAVAEFDLAYNNDEGLRVSKVE
ncbi:CRISPR-associated helicase Cas3/CRISPR-associated endonuclease Cas3-HD [Allocatelliglobosispora scoriae]|uniref:CRISPR-associated helicase Cas3/CRISPR-associated endonuclease Cas3-HD n=1 Tax=Allocatelliglobosispora scoriae TaxID=643052 RepID=A0A841C348_9ACTN|nr:CRISPR-associated helicase Cas3' [Allocatelliglobosispora scoriae]MBB5874336.1 CRISPR-associated helicase Cas3/CRISPR-associated endonuclease Cas3-HD [Allocatelliglobosispora scoriae]